MSPPRTITHALGAALLAFAPLSPAQDGTTDPGQRVQVALVFDEPVYLDQIDLNPRTAEINRHRINNELQFQQWLTEKRAQILRTYIFRTLVSAYLRENGITASEDEIDRVIAQERQDRADKLAQLEENLRLLQFEAEQLTADGKTVPLQLEKSIRIAQKKIDNHERKNVDNMKLNEKQRRLYEDVTRQRAATTIKNWKLNRVLHEQYGGRVIPDDETLTYEPFEAYHAWLQIEEQLGHFRILDDRFRRDFWAYHEREPHDAIEPFDGMWDSLRWINSGLP